MLVVDDEPSVRILVTEVLEELAYAAIAAAGTCGSICWSPMLVYREAWEVERLRRSVDEAATTIAAADESGAHVAAAQLQEEAAAASFEAARAEIANLLDAALNEDLAALAGRRLAATAAELAEVEAEIALMVFTVAELEAAAGDAARAHASLAAERERIGDDMVAAERRMRELRRTLGEDPDATDPEAVAARVDADRRAFQEANDRHTAARIELASALAAEMTARHRLEAANAARIQTDKAIAAARAERRDLAREWTAAALGGEPSGRGAAARGNALASRLAGIDGLLAEADQLSRSLREAAVSLELAALEARMADSAGGEDLTAHERVLLARLDEASAARRRRPKRPSTPTRSG